MPENAPENSKESVVAMQRIGVGTLGVLGGCAIAITGYKYSLPMDAAAGLVTVSMGAYLIATNARASTKNESADDPQQDT